MALSSASRNAAILRTRKRCDSHSGLPETLRFLLWFLQQQLQECLQLRINSVQTRCIVKGEAQKSPLFWRFSGGLWFSQERLFSRNSTRKPLNLIKSPFFLQTPCKSTCLYRAPSLHTVDVFLSKISSFSVHNSMEMSIHSWFRCCKVCPAGIKTNNALGVFEMICFKSPVLPFLCFFGFPCFFFPARIFLFFFWAFFPSFPGILGVRWG